MATWVRQGTGTAPTATDADLVGQYALDNATAPPDFDPAGVTSVRTEWTITGSGFGDDSWTNGSCAVVGGVSSTEISQHPSAGGTNLKNTSEASDHTDSTGIPTGLTVADWEAAFVRGDGNLIPNEWVTWNKVKGPDGSTLAVSALTVTITYEPAGASPVTVQAAPATLAAAAQTVDPIVAPPSDRVGFTANAVGNASSLALTKPTGTAEDDVLIVFLSDEGSGNVHTAPDGSWTQIGQLDGGDGRFSAWWKAAGASEPSSYTFSHGSEGDGALDLAGIIVAYRNRDTTAPIDDSSVIAYITDTNPSTSVTTTVAGCILAAGLMFDISSGKPPTNENYSSDEGMAKYHEDFGSGDLLHAGFDELAGSATTYTRTFTYSSTETNHVLALIALAPTTGASPVVVQASPASVSTAAQALTPVRDPISIPLAPASLALSAQAFTPSLTALEVPLTPATIQAVSQALNLSLSPLTTELVPASMLTSAIVLVPSISGGAVSVALEPASLATSAQALTPVLDPLTVQLVSASVGISSQAFTPVRSALSVELLPASLIAQAQALDLSLGALTTELVPASLQTLPQAFSPSLSPLAIELTPASLALTAQALGLNLTALTTELAPATLQTIAQALIPDIASLGVTIELVPASLLLAPQTMGLSLGALSVGLTPATAGVSAQALSPDLQALAVELVAASMGVSAQSLSPDLQALAVELAPALITIDGQVFTTTGLVTIELVPASLVTQALITDTEILAVSIPSGSDLAAVYRRSRVRRARGWQRPPSYR